MSEKPKETGAQLEARWRKFADTDHAQGMKLSDARKQAQHELIMAGQCLAYATAARELSAFLEELRELSAEMTDEAKDGDSTDGILKHFARRLSNLLGERVTDRSERK